MTEQTPQLLVEGVNGMSKVILQSRTGYTADVYLHGAHVTSWRDPADQELLFLSKHAKFAPPSAIRGGIPICWPQFGDMGPCKAQHGFARNSNFTVVEQRQDFVCLSLSSEQLPEAIREEFPNLFELQVDVYLNGDTLEQTLRVINPSHAAQPLSFTAALHTYFALLNGIDNVSIQGLKGVTYLDSLQGRKECLETEDEVKFLGEVDRIYVKSPNVLKIKDGGDDGVDGGASGAISGGASRMIVIEKTFPDAVVWNPAADKAHRMSDFGDEEWREMVCCEVGQAGSGAVQVAPGEIWEGKQVLEVVLSN